MNHLDRKFDLISLCHLTILHFGASNHWIKWLSGYSLFGIGLTYKHTMVVLPSPCQDLSLNDLLNHLLLMISSFEKKMAFWYNLGSQCHYVWHGVNTGCEFCTSLPKTFVYFYLSILLRFVQVMPATCPAKRISVIVCSWSDLSQCPSVLWYVINYRVIHISARVQHLSSVYFINCY